MSNELFSNRPEYRDLKAHAAETGGVAIKDLFAADSSRFEKFHVKIPGLLFDYSRHRVTDKTVALLTKLAQACDVEGWRRKMFSGEALNNSENRAVLHVALRGSTDKTLTVDGESVSGFVEDVLQKIQKTSDRIRRDKKITDVVNIGIGGSDLGTRMVYRALEPMADGPHLHFVANVDSAAIDGVLKTLQPETTLFVVVSKSFTTLETLANAQAAKAWLGRNSVEDHFLAVSDNVKDAKAFGIAPDNIFPLRKWIGGRYSIWSAVGLPVAIAFGFENFKKFLNGARDMDQHFLGSPLDKNMPVLMALLGIWYRNFFDCRAHAILPYAENLEHLPAWMQQLDMESNGKSVSRDGIALNYATSPVIFGEPGTNGQHAFFQALHQGTDIIPADFILNAVSKPVALNANALAQAQGLMEGRDNPGQPHRHYPGNRPSSVLVLDRLDAYHLGLLMALYEHKIFVQGVIWNINSFDQWGVELGKVLSNDIAQTLEKKPIMGQATDRARSLLDYLQSRSS